VFKKKKKAAFEIDCKQIIDRGKVELPFAKIFFQDEPRKKGRVRKVSRKGASESNETGSIPRSKRVNRRWSFNGKRLLLRVG